MALQNHVKHSLQQKLPTHMDFLAKGSLGRNKRFPSFLGAGVLNKRSEGIAKNHTAPKPLLWLVPELRFRKGARQFALRRLARWLSPHAYF